MSDTTNNFRCPETGEEFYFPTHSVSFKGGEKIYTDKWRKELINPKNGVKLVPIDKKVDWSDGVAPMIGTGTGKSGIAKRKKQLEKRSHEHYKKEIAESKYEKNKSLIRKFKNGE